MKVFRDMMQRQKSGDMSKYLIVDLNNLLHKAVYVHKDLYADSIFTGGLYGVLSQIKTAIEKYEISQVIVCNDCPPYFRDSLSENQFKADRQKREEEIETKLSSSRQMCEYVLGKFFTVWKIKGLESDDLIANAARCLQKYSEVYIASEDSDLYQRLRSNVSMIFKNRIFTEKDFKQTYDILVFKWAWISTLTGGHNGLPGFKGIGEKTALKIIQDENLLLDFIQKNPIALKYYYLSKLPILRLKMPALKVLTTNAIDNAEAWLKAMKFKVN